jgi:hypothetical protein
MLRELPSRLAWKVTHRSWAAQLELLALHLGSSRSAINVASLDLFNSYAAQLEGFTDTYAMDKTTYHNLPWWLQSVWLPIEFDPTERRSLRRRRSAVLRAPVTGELEIAVKIIAQGRPDDPASPVVTTVCFLPIQTGRGASGTRSSLRLWRDKSDASRATRMQRRFVDVIGRRHKKAAVRVPCIDRVRCISPFPRDLDVTELI